MGTEAEKIRIVDKNELVEKGKEIYKKIKDKLEPTHKGEVVAIEIKTGDYFLGKSVIEADRKARKKYPERYSTSTRSVIEQYMYTGDENGRLYR